MQLKPVYEDHPIILIIKTNEKREPHHKSPYLISDFSKIYTFSRLFHVRIASYMDHLCENYLYQFDNIPYSYTVPVMTGMKLSPTSLCLNVWSPVGGTV